MDINDLIGAVFATELQKASEAKLAAKSLVKDADPKQITELAEKIGAVLNEAPNGARIMALIASLAASTQVERDRAPDYMQATIALRGAVILLLSDTRNSDLTIPDGEEPTEPQDQPASAPH